MTTTRHLPSSLAQHALALALAATVTLGVLAGLLAEAGGGQAGLLAQRLQAGPQAAAPAAPAAPQV